MLRTSIHYEIAVPVDAPFTIGKRKNLVRCMVFTFIGNLRLLFQSDYCFNLENKFRIHSVLGECFNAVIPTLHISK
jgi:hypothetical protein